MSSNASTSSGPSKPRPPAGANWCSASPAWWPPRTSSIRGRSSCPRFRRRTAGSAPRFRRPSASSWSCRRGARRLSAPSSTASARALLVLLGGVLTGLAWVINSYATSLPGFYVGAVVGGLGVGAVYATCINNAIKWFPDKRGLAVGLTAAGYGSGTILTVIPIAQHDREFRIPGRVLHLWPDPGRRDRRVRLVPARAAARRHHLFGDASRSRAATTRSLKRFGRRCSG